MSAVISAELLNRIAPASQASLAEFCQRWQIVEMALFGSIIRDDFQPNSDIDVLVSFASSAEWGLFDHAQMAQELEFLLQRKVDLVSRRAIENSQNWIRRQNILSSAQVIYAGE